MDLPYEDPPLVCCFGQSRRIFVPIAPGGPPSNVAISYARLGGNAAFMEKVGSDEFGEEMVLMMNKENVQTMGVKFDDNARTGCAYMKIKFEDGKMRVEKVKESAENSLLSSELNLSVLKEVFDYLF
ncbi:Fructokinase-like 1 [Forsythia ovata]|uniref:Fructokinase-like 1 n=1 Tax=Forsythia ovata TaxID=205694 RepID=A0ABD1R648_9LAMI